MRQGERTALTVVAAAVTAALLLGGCSGSGDDPKPTPTPSGGQSVVETTTPTPTLSVTPPAMPVEAKKADPQGAAAFIRHYFDAMNYAYDTGDVGALRAVSASDCKSCGDMEKFITDVYAAGGRIEGGELSVTDVAVAPGDVALGLDANVAFAQAPARVLSRDGTVTEEDDGSQPSVIGFLVRYDGGWVVDEWGAIDVTG